MTSKTIICSSALASAGRKACSIPCFGNRPRIDPSQILNSSESLQVTLAFSDSGTAHAPIARCDEEPSLNSGVAGNVGRFEQPHVIMLAFEKSCMLAVQYGRIR